MSDEEREGTAATKCTCCEHSAGYGNWSERYCERRCVFEYFPVYYRELWGLYSKCTKWVSTGMGAVRELDEGRFEFRMRYFEQVPEADWEPLWEELSVLQDLLDRYQGKKAPFTEEDLTWLAMIDPEPEENDGLGDA